MPHLIIYSIHYRLWYREANLRGLKKNIYDIDYVSTRDVYFRGLGIYRRTSYPFIDSLEEFTASFINLQCDDIVRDKNPINIWKANINPTIVCTRQLHLILSMFKILSLWSAILMLRSYKVLHRVDRNTIHRPMKKKNHKTIQHTYKTFGLDFFLVWDITILQGILQ